MTITLKDVPGRCRWCQSTARALAACPQGCSWANQARTLCSSCVQLDRLMQSQKGRREIASFVADQGPGVLF